MALSGLMAGFFGIAPHVLHHVGPLAGAALFGGLGGSLARAHLSVRSRARAPATRSTIDASSRSLPEDTSLWGSGVSTEN